MWRWSQSPHEKWGERPIGAPRGPMNNPKSLGLRVSQKHAWRSCWKKWIDVKRSIVRSNMSCRKVSMRNIETISQKLLGYPIILEVHLHDKHFHIMRTIINKRSRSKHDAQNRDAIWRATKINKRRKIERQTRRWSTCACVGLDQKPHISQLRHKMFKSKRNDNKASENTREKNPSRIS